MTTVELRALVRDLDRVRFTFEDAERSGEGWIVYLYEARSALTYQIADYGAYREHYAYFPTPWISHRPRGARLGGELSATDAQMTLDEVARLLQWDQAGSAYRLRSIHVRYDPEDDDRYMAVVTTPTGLTHKIASLAAYLRMQG